MGQLASRLQCLFCDRRSGTGDDLLHIRADDPETLADIVPPEYDEITVCNICVAREAAKWGRFPDSDYDDDDHTQDSIYF